MQMMNFRCEPEKAKDGQLLQQQQAETPQLPVIYFGELEYDVKIVSNPGSEVELMI